MPKQLYIPLPCAAAREQMIVRQLSGVKYSLSPTEQKKIVDKTEGYSGSDMKNLVQEACQGPVRDAIQNARHGGSSDQNGLNGISDLSDSDLRPVVIKDFKVTLQVLSTMWEYTALWVIKAFHWAVLHALNFVWMYEM